MPEIKRGNAQKDHEPNEIRLRKIEGWFGLGSKLIENIPKWGFLFFLVWVVGDSWKATAGTVTVADIKAAFKLETINDAKDPLLIVLVVGSIVYARRQKKLRGGVIQRFQPHKEEYERSHDPHRTSSRLDKSGDTNERDK